MFNIDLIIFCRYYFLFGKKNTKPILIILTGKNRHASSPNEKSLELVWKIGDLGNLDGTITKKYRVGDIIYGE